MRAIAFILAGAALWRWADTYWAHDPNQPPVALAAVIVFAIGLILAVLGL